MKTKYLFFLISIFLFFNVNSQNTELNPLKIHELKVEYHNNPSGIDVIQPRFSWILTGKGRNRLQTAYQILVATTPEELVKNNGNAWDSRKVTSNNSNQIEYNGVSLQSATTYYWKVRVWNESGIESTWSEPSILVDGTVEIFKLARALHQL